MNRHDHWNIPVDVNGDRIIDRQSGPNDFLARSPVKCDFGGTYPKPKIIDGNVRLSDADHQKVIEARISYEIQALKNAENIEKAIFLVSQTDDGRRLLAKAKTAGCEIVFDSGIRDDFNGLFSPTDNQVVLKQGRTPEAVAKTLKHEMQHWEDNQNGGATYNTETLRSKTIGSRCLEANARVSESIYAIELAHGSAYGPNNQFKSQSGFAEIAHAPYGQVAQKNQQLAKKGEWNKLTNKIFQAYFEDERTLSAYDELALEDHVKIMTDEKTEIQKKENYEAKGGEKNHRYFSKEQIELRVNKAKRHLQTAFTLENWSAEKALDVITIRGKSFLEFDKNFSVDSPVNAGLTKAGMASLDKVKNHVEALGENFSSPNAVTVTKWKEKGGFLKKIGLGKTFNKVSYASSCTPEFKAIVPPYRVDGSSLSSGENSKEVICDAFNRDMESTKKMPYSDDFQVIRSAVVTGFHKSTLNNQGSIGEMLEAGLKAPMGAFPQEYLTDLCRRVKKMSSSPIQGSSKFMGERITPHEIKLMGHWKEMQSNGIDVMWGVPKADIHKVADKNRQYTGKIDTHLHNKVLLRAISDEGQIETPNKALKKQNSVSR